VSMASDLLLGAFGVGACSTHAATPAKSAILSTAGDFYLGFSYHCVVYSPCFPGTVCLCIV
jgi:hypothetical protein